jgi:hypothetical protein
VKRVRRGDLPGCVLIVGAAFAALWAGIALAALLTQVLLPKMGMPGFLVLLGATTGVWMVTCLVDWGKVSGFYRKWHRDTWLVFVQVFVWGFGSATLIAWAALFKLGVLPFRYIWVFLVVAVVFFWLLDRKERRTKRGRP